MHGSRTSPACAKRIGRTSCVLRQNRIKALMSSRARAGRAGRRFRRRCPQAECLASFTFTYAYSITIRITIRTRISNRQSSRQSLETTPSLKKSHAKPGSTCSWLAGATCSCGVLAAGRSAASSPTRDTPETERVPGKPYLRLIARRCQRRIPAHSDPNVTKGLLPTYETQTVTESQGASRLRLGSGGSRLGVGLTQS